mgnify:FL=1
MSITLEEYLTNQWYYNQQYVIRNTIKEAFKTMDAELSSFMDRAFNGEFDYPVCI